MSKKFVVFILFSFVLVFSGCSKEDTHIKTEKNTFSKSNDVVEISKEQFEKITDILDENKIPTSLVRGVQPEKIQKITKSDKLIQFTADISKLSKSSDKFYYTVYNYGRVSFAIVYEEDSSEEYDNQKYICGCITFAEKVDSKKLKEAKSFADIKTLDLSVGSDGKLSNCSAVYSVSRSDYSPENISAFNTLSVTDDGLYFVSYDTVLELDDNPKITSIEKVDNSIYNAMYNIIIKDYIS